MSMADLEVSVSEHFGKKGEESIEFKEEENNGEEKGGENNEEKRDEYVEEENEKHKYYENEEDGANDVREEKEEEENEIEEERKFSQDTEEMEDDITTEDDEESNDETILDEEDEEVEKSESEYIGEETTDESFTEENVSEIDGKSTVGSVSKDSLLTSTFESIDRSLSSGFKKGMGKAESNNIFSSLKGFRFIKSFVTVLLLPWKISCLSLRGKEVYKRIGRRIEDNDLPLLLEFLEANPNIQTVDFSYNNISDEGMRIIANFLKTNTNLLGLNIMNNDIGWEGITHLADIAANISLKWLRLNGNKIGREGGVIVAEFLQKNKKLEWLDLGEADFEISSVVRILGSFGAMGCNSTLKCLDLSRILGVPMYHLATEHLAGILGQVLKDNKSLDEIHFQKNNFTDVEIRILLENGLSENTTVKVLDLTANAISNLGLSLISDYLKKNKNLEVLFLSHNKISNAGASFISKVINRSGLKILDLSHNNIKDVGMMEILNSICSSHRLISLLFWGNPVTSESAMEVDQLKKEGRLLPSASDIFIDPMSGLPAFDFHANPYKFNYYNQTGNWLRSRLVWSPILKMTVLKRGEKNQIEGKKDKWGLPGGRCIV